MGNDWTVSIFDDVANDWSPRYVNLHQWTAVAVAYDLLNTLIFAAVKMHDSHGEVQVFDRLKHSQHNQP